MTCVRVTELWGQLVCVCGMVLGPKQRGPVGILFISLFNPVFAVKLFL